MGETRWFAYCFLLYNLLQSLIDIHGLIDLGFCGSPFMWSNNRGGLAKILREIGSGLGKWRLEDVISTSQNYPLGTVGLRSFPLIVGDRWWCTCSEETFPF